MVSKALLISGRSKRKGKSINIDVYTTRDNLIWQIDPDIITNLKLGDSVYVQRLLRRMVKYFHKIRSVAYISPIAVELGITLRQVHILANILVESGELKAANADDVIGTNINSSDVVYVLNETAKVWLAHD